jgi:hypothetical protein
MGAGLNCWRVLLLVRGARICEIPDDAEMKGHHRICHSQRWHGQWNEIDLNFRRCSPRPRCLGRHHRLQSVPTVVQRILCLVYRIAVLLLLQPPSTTTPKRRTLTLPQRGQSSSKSGIRVSILPPDSGTVPIGRSKVVDATVTGITNTAVKWSVTGMDCSGCACA